MKPPSDTEILHALREVDEGPWSVTSWESKFLDSLLSRVSHKPLSARQREVAIGLIEKHLGRLFLEVRAPEEKEKDSERREGDS
jgi:hypothetical protein